MRNYVSIIIAGPFEDELSAVTACDILAGTAKARGWPVVDEQYCRIADTATEDEINE